MNQYLLAATIAALSAVSSALAQPQITQIEVNQSLGAQLNGTLNFVSGKDTVVRVYLDSAVAIDPTQTSLKINKDGQDVTTLTPRPASQPVNIVEFLCPDRPTCGGWAAGSYVFTAVVNGVTKATDAGAYKFQDRVGLRILARPVKANYNGVITSVADDRWRRAWEYTRGVYPVAADKVFWDVREEFDASDPKYNLETNDGRLALWETLTNLVPPHCAANPKGSGCYDLVVGFISDRPNTYPNGTLQGFTYGRPSNIVVASDEDMEATIAHEIAHTFGVGDTYDGGSFACTVNPAPDGFNGKSFGGDGSQQVSCTSGRVTYPGASATTIPAAAAPYDVGGRGALPDMADFMGSGTKQSQYWITPDVYNVLFTGMAPPAPPPPSNNTAMDQTTATSKRLLFYAGVINAQGQVKAEPWWGLLSSEAVTDSKGDTQIQAVDANGAVLATQAFNLQFYVNSRPPRVVDWAPFEGAVRFPDGTARFQIVQKGTVIFDLPVSANDPVVVALTPTSAGANLDGPQTISWMASDADGDALVYTVEYNPRPSDPTSDWIVLANDISSTQWNDDFSTLPGAAAGQIRITASDGIRSSQALSQTFVVSYKAPLAYINALDSNTFAVGSEVRLRAEAEDLQDGILDGKALTWTSSISGPIGSGSEIVVTTLPAGAHTITLTATNSAGLTTTQTVAITVQ